MLTCPLVVKNVSKKLVNTHIHMHSTAQHNVHVSILIIHVYRHIHNAYWHLYFVAWQPNFDKHISSHKRGGGVRGVEQWIRMAIECKIVVLSDTGPASEGFVYKRLQLVNFACELDVHL